MQFDIVIIIAQGIKHVQFSLSVAIYMCVCVCVCVYAEPEITVGHRTFSDQKYWMSGHFEIWSGIFSGQIFGFLLILKYFPYFTLFCLKKFLNV